MTHKNRWYLGLALGKRELFRCAFDPTRETHGKFYLAVVGPFNTHRAAELMRDYGQGNPHYQCVADAERIARSSRMELTAT